MVDRSAELKPIAKTVAAKCPIDGPGKNKFAIPGTEARGRQGAKRQAYLYIQRICSDCRTG
jgi:hypothetical protein